MTQTNLTPEQLADAVARIAELDAKRPAIDLNTAEIHEDGLTYECPLCQGDGYVDGHQYINVSDKALNVFFSGIGSEFVDARRFFDAAPLMAQIIRQLWAERQANRAAMVQARDAFNDILSVYAEHHEVYAFERSAEALAQLDAALGGV